MSGKKVLFVMSDAIQREFGELVSAEEIDWIGVETCAQARAALAQDDAKIAAIVSDETLPDGSWYCLLTELVRRELSINLIVALPSGGDPSVIKSCGVYGVVNYPPDAAALRLIVEAVHTVSNGVSVG